MSAPLGADLHYFRGMRHSLFLVVLLVFSFDVDAQDLITPFEKSGGKESATYEECIAFYEKLVKKFPGKISMDTAGETDAGIPLHLIHYNNINYDSDRYDRGTHPMPILVNNGIHPGEPDGIDACMMLLRDACTGKTKIPDNVELYVIPVYNIGGMLNRGSYSRVNQNGPKEYGFRGNAQNLDLNRDFTKCDSKESKSFAMIFHRIQPWIFIDTHVSDGADYQHVVTLLSTQYDKLGYLGQYMRDSLDPAIYRDMNNAGWPMVPYINTEGEAPEKGWKQFLDPPRFGSGYAALWNCISYVIETHMLKPYDQRVKATYKLIETIIKESNTHLYSLYQRLSSIMTRDTFEYIVVPLNWTADTTRFTRYPFKGYRQNFKTSDVTGLERMFYDHKQPFTDSISIYDHYVGKDSVRAPFEYIIPQAWTEVIERLQINGVYLSRLEEDESITVTTQFIDSFQTVPIPYEKHYKHYNIKTHLKSEVIRFQKGDYKIQMWFCDGGRFLVEMLEPRGDDSYFAWNFFDAILQQKEGYSDYRWEDVAAQYLKDHPEARALLEQAKKDDTTLVNDASRQLKFVYQHSPWMEKEYRRYPVYRVE